jgi:Tol biopolymer transport system component
MAQVRRRLTCSFARWVLGLVALVVALLSVAPTAVATFPGRNGRIAISGPLGPFGQGVIATIRPDGTGFRELTEYGGGSSPDWFADGRRLLFLDPSNKPGVVAADGSRRSMVPVRVGGALSIAPDGRYFTYLGDAVDADVFEIWRAATDGTQRRRIGAGWMPRWSPDGRRIAFWGAGGLSVMNAATGKHVRVLVRVLAPPAGPGARGASLDWSPDGRRLLFAPTVYGGFYTVRANGKARVRRLIAPGRVAGIWSAVWSPNGKRIAFTTVEHVGDDSGEMVSYWTANPRGDERRHIYSSDVFDGELVGGEPELSWGARP